MRYRVERSLLDPAGRPVAVGATVEWSERQARYAVLAGKLVPLAETQKQPKPKRRKRP